eukprot:TRINITY_DN17435_c0_g1_i1.p1 TRINITY_DN17435_c0_g1~~TRINITY_DN17435_c0_g1_i1.p1  ORF type:complete len:470 (-),score=105.60 TRINITY_DN17435_c0_g1_i1:82-1491(-)
MRLDATMLRYLSKDDFRVLTAVEMGLKNHELVPAQLIESIAGLKRGGAYRGLQNLLKHKLVHHDSKKYDGYKLTYLGYDFLALRAMTNRGSVGFVGRQIGVGKESDVYIVANAEDEEMALKLHRLGRISFRTIKTKRDYLLHRKNASWLYMSRLAALKEYAYMKVLYDHGFPVPKPIDVNRHCVLMQLLKATPLCQVRDLANPGLVYSRLMNLILKFAQHGLIHCDFNEFNLLIDDDQNVFIIDFPQMVSTSHPNANEYFDRDVQCIRTFFSRKLGFEGSSYPIFERDVKKEIDLDTQVKASGFSKQQDEELHRYAAQIRDSQGEEGEGEGFDEESGEEDSDGTQEDDSHDSEEENQGEGQEEDADESAFDFSKVSLEEQANPDQQELGDGDAVGKDKLQPHSTANVIDADGQEADDNSEESQDDETEREIRNLVRRQVQRKYGTRTTSRNQTKTKGKRKARDEMKATS